MDTTNIMFTRCMHGFHTQCLTQWLESGCTCPVCREQLKRPVSPTSVLDFDSIEFFLPNYDLGQRLDYGDI